MYTVTTYSCFSTYDILCYCLALIRLYVLQYTLFSLKEYYFPLQAEYSYFSADFSLKIFSDESDKHRTSCRNVVCIEHTEAC